MRISDWSSDVCSSDLPAAPHGRPAAPGGWPAIVGRSADRRGAGRARGPAALPGPPRCREAGSERGGEPALLGGFGGRSEGRRVGQECVSTGRTRWAQYHQQTKNNKESNAKKEVAKVQKIQIP